MKKIIISLTLLVTLLSNNKINVEAVTYSENISIIEYQGLEDFTIRDDNYVYYGGGDVKMYSTFDDLDVAIDTLYMKIPDYLNKLSQEYDLDRFSEENWMQYWGYSRIYIADFSDEDAQEVKDQSYFMRFIDIFENTFKNQEITDYVDMIPSILTLYNVIPVNVELELMLPFNSPRNGALKSLSISPMAAGNSFNINNGITYATNHAKNGTFNGNATGTKEYFDFTGAYYGGDCANFASQILEHGGVKQRQTGNASTGWWHIKTSVYEQGQWSKYIHTHSYSFIRADTFAKTFGVQGQYLKSQFLAFSQSLQKGDFIIYDKEGDGDWDHVGFVTDVSTAIVTSNGVTFRNFRVAQHSDGYHDWVANKDNGWEIVETKYYGVVSRNGVQNFNN